MSVKIIVDSTADLIPEIKDRVEIVPMTISFGDEEYIGGVTITNEEFYKKLENCDELPRTSQATPAVFDAVFKEVTDNGDTAVVITLGSKLSGTYQSAVIAASDYEDKIYVVDGKSVAIGLGVLAQYALDLVDSGKQAKEIAQLVETASQKICIIALVDTLEYLKRGGRISKAAAVAGGLLSIKPLLAIEDGEVNVIGKARGLKQGNALIINEIENRGGIDAEYPILLGYTGLNEVPINNFIDENKEYFSKYQNEIKYTIIGSVIGTHVGPGACAVGFLKK